MWLLYRTGFAYAKTGLSLALSVASCISLLLFWNGSIEGISQTFRITFIVCLVIGIFAAVGEKQDQLFIRLPLSRLQVIASDAAGFLTLAGVFYISGNLASFLAGVPISIGYLIDQLGIYFYTLTLMALVIGAMMIVGGFRKRWLVIPYVAVVWGIPLAIGYFEEPLNLGQTYKVFHPDRIEFMLLGMELNFTVFCFVTAVASLTLMYWLYARVEYVTQ